MLKENKIHHQVHAEVHHKFLILLHSFEPELPDFLAAVKMLEQHVPALME